MSLLNRVGKVWWFVRNRGVSWVSLILTDFASASPWWCLSALHSENHCWLSGVQSPHPGSPRFIMFRFTAPHRSCVFANWMFIASLCQESVCSMLFTALAYSVSLGRTVLTILQTFSLLHPSWWWVLTDLADVTLWLAEGSNDGFFEIKYLLRYVPPLFFSYNAVTYLLNRLQEGVDTTFTCTGKLRFHVNPFIAVVWTQTTRPLRSAYICTCFLFVAFLFASHLPFSFIFEHFVWFHFLLSLST